MLRRVAFIIAILWPALQFMPAFNALAAENSAEPVRILHIMSYHRPWRWTDEQFQGFKDGLGLANAEYKVFEMDTKRRSSDAHKVNAARAAHAMIKEWKPHLVYTNDDIAQEYVARTYVGQDLPIVFSGVNAAPEDYQFAGSPNVTGVLERVHFEQSVRFLRKIVPDVRRIAVVIDDGPTWPGIVKQMKIQLANLPEIEVVHWDTITTFAEYQERIMAYQSEVDAVALLGIFTFRDENGENVPYQDVLKWTVENSELPDFSFWSDRVDFGTLSVVSVSGYQQGLAAGKKARSILVDGASPGDIAMEPTTRGEPYLNIMRADRLGIRVRSTVLLSSRVVKDYEWLR